MCGAFLRDEEWDRTIGMMGKEWEREREKSREKKSAWIDSSEKRSFFNIGLEADLSFVLLESMVIVLHRNITHRCSQSQKCHKVHHCSATSTTTTQKTTKAHTYFGTLFSEHTKKCRTRCTLRINICANMPCNSANNNKKKRLYWIICRICRHFPHICLKRWTATTTTTKCYQWEAT